MKKRKTNKKIHTALAVVQAVERRAIIIAVMLILLLSVLYAYFVISAIVSTVVYKDININISKLHSEIASLETEYIISKNNITGELALAIGLKEITDKTFIKRTTHVGRAE